MPQPHSGSHISCSFMLLTGAAIRIRDNSDTLPLLTNPHVPARLRALPVVDVGANDGRDYTLPAALLGHRVYSFEPTERWYDVILKRIASANVTSSSHALTHTSQLQGFEAAPAGTIFLRRGLAVSNRTGTAVFTTTRKGNGVSNSLNGVKALPRTARRSAQTMEVALTTLDEVLAPRESRGLFLLKIDAQGHEYSILQGAAAYIESHPVHYILLEFYPKGLRAGGVDPLQLLQLLQHRLRYQCFDLRCNSAVTRSALTLEQFVRKYPPVAANEFGTWTDLLCTRFDLL